MSTSSEQYDIFLSYSHKDTATMRLLRTKLTQGGLSVWTDEKLEPGETVWQTAIEDAIRQALCMVVILSPNAKTSEWINDEITVAKRRSLRIFPILIKGDEDSAVPLSLANTHFVDARQGNAQAIDAQLLPSVQRYLVKVKGQPAAVKALSFTFDWVTIPVGEFLMGSDKKKDKQAFDNELPQHSLYLPEFRIARVPVTVAQFARFVAVTGFKTSAEMQGWALIWSGTKYDKVEGADWSHPCGPTSNVNKKQDHPVTCVSWIDAQAFCRRAGVRLPSEAEWEKAARGTDGRIYPWGNQAPDKSRCNFNDNVGDTTPVGGYPKGASPYGVMDMAGNVREWTTTKWVFDNYRNYKPDDGPGGDVWRVVRGGAFSSSLPFVRCAGRFYGSPNDDVRRYGFRVVLSPSGS